LRFARSLHPWQVLRNICIRRGSGCFRACARDEQRHRFVYKSFKQS
jgi:hypothetical protein